jgi:hypothetical protein
VVALAGDAGTVTTYAKVMLAGLPLYLVVAFVADTMLGSGSPISSTRAPMWMVVGFCLTALLGAGVTLWYFLFWRRKADKASDSVDKAPSRSDKLPAGPGWAASSRIFDWRSFVAIAVSSGAGEGGKRLATALLGEHPWWVLMAIYAVDWAVLVAVLDILELIPPRRAQRRTPCPVPAPNAPAVITNSIDGAG